MLKRVAAVALAVALAGAASARTPSGLPVDIAVAKPPSPVAAAGRIRLLYELRVTNFHHGPMALERVDVLVGDEGPVLASLGAADLDKAVMIVGAADDAAPGRAIEAGRTAVVFVDLALASGAAAPAALGHTLTFRIPLKDGDAIERAVTLGPIPVGPPARVLASPLRGAGWVAANGLANPDHRRAFNGVDGRERLAQRFAIDWVRLGPDRRMFRGDPKRNASYYAYGAEVLAVADARVAAVIDGLPEYDGATARGDRRITLDNILGDAVVLDLGDGTYAVYAHLQPGSVAVKAGDTVRSGQPLARLGNSGNSDAPHLHFQLVDGPSPLGSEGVPYALSAFAEEGVLDDIGILDTGAAWRPPASARPAAHRGEFPVDNAVVDFPD